MSSEVENRLHELEKSKVRTEVSMEQQGKRLDKLDKDFVSMNDILQGILHTLNQIKWVGTGIGLAIFAQQFGIVEILKKGLGL
jgi:hypothetical protein